MVRGQGRVLLAGGKQTGIDSGGSIRRSILAAGAAEDANRQETGRRFVRRSIDPTVAVLPNPAV